MYKWKARQGSLGRRPQEVIDQLMAKTEYGKFVVDVGGGKSPFNRADSIIDIISYDDRRNISSKLIGYGPENEQFSRRTWRVLDITKTRIPFEDKQVDFIVCSHVLEHLRDPLAVCREMIRTSKAGYIECPSRTMETIMDLECAGVIGYRTHKWFVEHWGNNGIVFTNKTHMLYSNPKFYFPSTHRKKVSREDKIIWLFWKDSFIYDEQAFYTEWDIVNDLKEFIGRDMVDE